LVFILQLTEFLISGIVNNTDNVRVM